MGHDHSEHDHSHGHSHEVDASAGNARRLLWIFIFTAGYAAVQAVGGWLSGSLALIADAGHMISDAAALLLALVAYKMAARPATMVFSYGFHRARVLAALANGAALLLLVVWIIIEAIRRFNAPVEVLAGPMLGVAIIGLLVNIIGAWVLLRGDQEDSNLRGALLHVLGDLLGSVGAIAAAIGIMLTGWLWLDPVLSVFVSLLIVRAAWALVRESILILMQQTPTHLVAADVLASLNALPDVAEAGHLHLWTLADRKVMGSVHIVPVQGVDPLDLTAQVSTKLEVEFKIAHSTVQIGRSLLPCQC